MISKRLASALWILQYPLKPISISNPMELQHRHPLGARFSSMSLFHNQCKRPHHVNVNSQIGHWACLGQRNNNYRNNTFVKAMIDQHSRVGHSLNPVAPYLQTSNASEGSGRDDLERLGIRGVPLGRQSNRLQSEKLVVAVDIDEVLGNFLLALNTFIAEHYFLNHNIAEYHVYNFDKVWKCSLAEANVRVHEFFKSKHFREGIHPIPGAYQALFQLRSFCHFSIATSRQNVIKQQTIDWVERHYSGLFKEIYFGNHFSFDGAEKSKSEICRSFGAQILIDDNPRYAVECAENGIEVLLFDYHNSYPWCKISDVSLHPLITKVHNWQEVKQHLVARIFS